MFIDEIIKELQNRENSGDFRKARVACANCGKTWVEIIGSLIAHKEGREDICLHIGMESENCQMCRYRPIECQACGSSDIYEIDFVENISEETPLIFKDVRKVTVERTTQ